MTLVLRQPKEGRKQDFELLLHSPHSVLRNWFVALGMQFVEGLTDHPASGAGSFGVPREQVFMDSPQFKHSPWKRILALPLFYCKFFNKPAD